MNDRKYFLGNKMHIPNAKGLGFLKDVNPVYAQHMYYKNRIAEAFAMSQFGGVDILDLPVCGSCEKPGFWHNDASCLCPACGKVTPKATTMRDYLMDQIKLPESTIEQLEAIIYKEEPA